MVKKERSMTSQANSRQSLSYGIATLLIFIFLCVWTIVTFTKHEKQRDLNHWQTTLDIVANSKTQAVNRWIRQSFAVMERLAENPSLQMYSQQLIDRNDQETEIETSQISYLRNLIYATAEQNGFLDSTQTKSPIKANISYTANRGIAVIGKNFNIVTATPGFEKLSPELTKIISQVAITQEPAIIDINLNSNQVAVIGFAVPFHGLQHAVGKLKFLGVIYGYLDAESSLYPILQSDGNHLSKTMATMLYTNQLSLEFFLNISITPRFVL